jgi:hypothetical protein
MQRLKDLVSAARPFAVAVYSRLRDLSPSICYLIAAALAASVAVSIGYRTLQARQVDDALVAAVRHELATVATASELSAIGGKVDGLTSSVATMTEYLTQQATAIVQLQASVDSLKLGGRRARSTATSSPSCIRLPSGCDVDVGTLTAAAQGGNVLGTGETYAAALVRHGFLVAEVEQLDESTCQKIYDGWRTLYPPEVRPALSTRSSGRWTCTGGRCYRN